MFWNNKKVAHKAKRLSLREIISQIEELCPGDSVNYRLSVSQGGQVAVVLFNSGYPWRTGKYILSIQTREDGIPAGEKENVLKSDEAEDIASWLSRRHVKLLNLSQDYEPL
jgi:hypothetical protein